MPLSRAFSVATLLCTISLPAFAEAPAAAVQAFEAGRYAEAQKGFASHVSAHPQDADGAYWNGRALLAMRQTEAAVEWLEKATKLAPRRSDAFLALGRAYGRAAQEASMFGKPGLAKKARIAWEQAVALDPANLDARGDLVLFHMMAPGLMGGSLDEAHRQAAEIGKRDAIKGAVARANLAQHAEDFAGAERILQDALARNAGNAPLRLALGLLFQAQQKWDAAFAVYDAMLAEKADTWDALYQVGRAAALSGQRLERGATALERYLGHTPGPQEPALANAHYRLGMVREKQGNRGGARGEYQAALRLDGSLDDAREALERLGS